MGMRNITKTVKIEMVRELLLKNDEFLEEALQIIYEHQTWSEKVSERTRYVNKIGFNRPDGAKLSQYADLLAQGHHLKGQSLADARDRMVKYAKQLTESEEIQSLFFESQITGVILSETPLAVQIQAKNQVIWVPKSAIHSRYFSEKPGVQEFLVDQWVIRKKLGRFITGAIHGETELALQLQLPDKALIWVPKSVIYSTYDSTSHADQPFLVADWFLQSKNL
jgi:hypothetical protein